jgi:hypothetical protein
MRTRVGASGGKAAGTYDERLTDVVSRVAPQIV